MINLMCDGARESSKLVGVGVRRGGGISLPPWRESLGHLNISNPPTAVRRSRTPQLRRTTLLLLSQRFKSNGMQSCGGGDDAAALFASLKLSNHPHR